MNPVVRLFITFLCVIPIRVTAQEYLISTVAGGGLPIGSLPALETNIGYPIGVATDSLGNVYFSSSLNVVFKLSPNGSLTRFAGSGTAGYSGDGGPATSGQLNFPAGLAVDSSGNVYIADSNNGRIRKVTPNGVITTVAGNCCVVTQTVLTNPTVVAVDSSGALYVGEQGKVLKLPPGGTTTTLVTLDSAAGLAIDPSGNLFVADVNQVLKISRSGVVTTFAGTPQGYFDSGDGGPAINATFGIMSGLALDSTGGVMIADGSIREITPDGNIHTLANSACCSALGGIMADGGNGSIGVDAAGNTYVALFLSGLIRKVTPTGVVTTVAGNLNADNVGDGGPAVDAQLSAPEAIAADALGNLYIADYGNSRVRKVTPSGMITTIAGNGTSGFSGDDGSATAAQLGGPVGVAVDHAGNLFISEYLNNRVRKVSVNGTITTVAGNGGCCTLGDNGPAINAELAAPHGIAVDQAGNLYIADSLYSRIRKVTLDGIITTIAGTGVRGFSGDGGPATQAELNYPWGVAVDAGGNVFVADNQNQRARKISADGIISTVAAQSQNFSTDPAGVAVDDSGNLFISGEWIWRVAPDGAISPVSFSPRSSVHPTQITGSGIAIDVHGNILVVNGNVIQELEHPPGPARRR